MALLWVEGFDKFGPSGANISPVWGAPDYTDIVDIKYKSYYADIANVEAGRYGGYALRLDSSSTIMMTPHLATKYPERTLMCGFAFKTPTLTSGQWVVDFRHPIEQGETVGWGQFTLKVAGSGNNAGLYVNRGNTTLNSSVNGSWTGMLEDTWYYIEMKVYCHETSGTVNVHVDGVEVLHFTGNTRHRYSQGCTGYSAVLLHSRPSNIAHIYDDMYIADGSGSGVTDLLGPCRVESIAPTSDVSTGNWTPNSGVNLYDNINEQEMDADFIYTNEDSDRAMFETTNLSANISTGTVRGIMLNCESEQYQNSVQYAKAMTQNGSSGNVAHSGNFRPGRGWAYSHGEIMELDPDGNAWTPSTVNQLRIGVEATRT